MPTSKGVDLNRIVARCDQWFPNRCLADWDGAYNGLQVENRGRVHRIAAAVDARQATIEAAARGGANLLLVHHGLFWGSTLPWTGSRYRLLQSLLEHDLAVYSLHLPLDEHPRFGNNVLLCRALGLRRLRRFFSCKGRKIGYQATVSLARDELVRRLAEVTGHDPHLLPGGPKQCRRIGVVTGGAGSEMAIAAAEGVDTFVTGEGPHWTHALADDLGLNVIYAGHYATETFGVKALAQSLSREFGVPWAFVDYPTGL